MRHFALVIDGVDGTGKSTVCSILRKRFGDGVDFIDEFSSSPIGNLIRAIVKEERFFRLSDPRLPAAELFFLLSDVAVKYEEANRKEGRGTIMDRGIISAIAYQSVRWEEIYGVRFSDEKALDLLELFSELVPGTRNLMHVNLSIRIPTINQRIRARDETPLSQRGLDTLAQMQRRIMLLGSAWNCHEIAVDDVPAEQVADLLVDLSKL